MQLKNFFQKPRVITLTLAAIAALFLSLRILSGLLSPSAQIRALDLSTENILQAVNRERGSRNLALLNTNGLLSSAADYKAHDMITRKYFAHTDPEGQYIWPKIASLGYAPYSMLGENLAIEFYSTDSLVQAWMDSPTHRANILQEGFRDQGMGLAFGSTQNGEYGTSIANTFGTLLPKKPTPPPPAPAPAKPKPAPVTKPAPKKVVTVPPKPKPAPAPAKPKPAPVKAAEIKVEEKVEEVINNLKNLNPINPRGIAEAFQPLLPETQKATTEVNFENSHNIQPTEAPQLPEPTPLYQEAPPAGGNPYQQYRLWGIIVAIAALALLAMEAKKFIQDKIHIPRHRWNTILMLILTLLVTALAYII